MILKRLFVILPVYNESENISRVIENVDAVIQSIVGGYEPTFLVIDDGSRPQLDFTDVSLAPRSVTVLRHERNLGPGAAFATAFTYLFKLVQDHDLVIMMEGDGTSDPALIPNLLNRLQEGFDVVLASPYVYGGSIYCAPVHRRIISELGGAYARITLGLRGIWTVSSFYRLYAGHEIRDLQELYGPGIIQSSGFEGVLELLAKSAHKSSSISEVPSCVSQEKRLGRSKMRVLRTSVGYLRLSIQMRRLLSATHLQR